MPVITVDSTEARYLSEHDWRLAHLIARVGDLEYGQSASAFQALAHSIIEQMLSMKAGATISARLRALCEYDISPQVIAVLTVEQLRGCGISERKAKSLHGLAAYACEHDLEALANASDDEVRSELQQLSGIGRWTCDMFLLFHLGRPDVLPVEDGAVRQAFQWLYGVPLTSPEAREIICSLWHPYCSTAVRYLYRALNEGLVAAGDAREVLGY